MIDWISSWAQGIVIAVIIATILEMLLPEGKNKKYIKAVIGVYILFTILSPIIEKITNKDITVNWDYEKYFANTSIGEGTANTLSTINDNSIEDIYVSNLKSDIQTRLKEKGYQTNSIQITINVQDNELYGTIDKLKLELTKKVQSQEEETNTITNSINPIEPIQKVQIGNTNTNQQNSIAQEGQTLSKTEIKEIKEYLNTVYEIKKQNIVINE